MARKREKPGIGKEKKVRMRTRSLKAKGRRLQQWTAMQISGVTGWTYGKDRPIRSREMGQSGVDVVLVPEVLEEFPFSIECKNQESWSVPSWIEQAQKNVLPNTDWLLVCKRNNKEPVVVLDAMTFFFLMGDRIGQDYYPGKIGGNL